MAVIIRPNSSLALDATIALDAANPASYPGSGNIWTDVSSVRGDNAILTDVTWSSTNSGIFNFNGSTSVARISNRNWNFDAEQTIMVALQRLSVFRHNPYNQAYGGAGTWTHETSGQINYFWGTNGRNGGPYVSLSSATVSPNEWAIMTTTRDPSTVIWYKNGVATSSRSNPYGSNVNSGPEDILIGDGYAGNYAGNIALCFVWDRALSDTEVKTYYDRLKSRFGLS